jgi:hypothetical protein
MRLGSTHLLRSCVRTSSFSQHGDLQQETFRAIERMCGRSYRRAVRSIALGLVVAACGGSGGSSTTPTPKTTPVAPPSSPVAATTLAITGKVTEVDDSPLEGVTVHVFADPWTPGSEVPPLADLTTDAAGEFKAAVPPGRYTLRMYYVDIAVQRAVDITAATVIDQQIDGRWMGSGHGRACEAREATSCKPID